MSVAYLRQLDADIEALNINSDNGDSEQCIEVHAIFLSDSSLLYFYPSKFSNHFNLLLMPTHASIFH